MRSSFCCARTRSTSAGSGSWSCIACWSWWRCSAWASGCCRAPALAVLGFLSFVVFGLTELLRTSLGIFALNRAWRGGYAAATDDTTRAYFRAQIAGFGGWNDGLFLLFALAFFLGTLLYGLALRRGQGLEKTVGIVLLVWSIFGGHAVLEEASGFGPLAPYLGWVGPGFQPLARLLTAVWLWRTAGEPVGRAA